MTKPWFELKPFILGLPSLVQLLSFVQASLVLRKAHRQEETISKHLVSFLELPFYWGKEVLVKAYHHTMQNLAHRSRILAIHIMGFISGQHLKNLVQASVPEN